MDHAAADAAAAAAAAAAAEGGAHSIKALRSKSFRKRHSLSVFA
jgi:hypothetical protein